MKHTIISSYGLLKGEVTDFHSLDDEYGDPVPYIISKGLITGCAVCNRNDDDVKKCGGCKVVSYCSREHQLADRSEHKYFCNKIVKGYDNIKKEEEKLNSHPGSMWMERNPFENHVGHFWSVRPTRNYMRARYSVVDGLVRINSVLAIQLALDNILDMLRLCRSDNIGARSLVPALYIRLGRDQEAYDFLKWYGTTGNEGDYDWGNMSLGYLDVHDADIFEPVYLFIKDYALELAHMMSLLLLKIRLAADLVSLNVNSGAAKTLFSDKAINKIQERGPMSRFGDKTAVFKQNQSQHLRNLKQQIKLLFNTIKCANSFMWPAMLKPGNDLTARPYKYCRRERTEMQLALQYNYNAYKESVGAFDVIKKLVG